MSKVRLIDANGLIDRINENLVGTQVGSYAEGIYLDVIDSINRSPTIKAEPVRCGEWTETEMQGQSGRRIKYHVVSCSVCKKSNGRKRNQYCPNCGVKWTEVITHEHIFYIQRGLLFRRKPSF